MHIPHLLLTPGALRAIVEEVVTRDGTDHSAIERRIERVIRQLDGGSAELHFEQETATCSILPVVAGQNPPAGNGNT
jgi:uncharacterized protein YheU (UPF0270 family)